MEGGIRCSILQTADYVSTCKYCLGPHYIILFAFRRYRPQIDVHCYCNITCNPALTNIICLLSSICSSFKVEWWYERLPPSAHTQTNRPDNIDPNSCIPTLGKFCSSSDISSRAKRRQDETVCKLPGARYVLSCLR